MHARREAIRWTVFCLVVSCGFCTRAAADGLVLVDKGEPKATIVLPADAHDLERLAAKELAAYIQKVSGATLQTAERVPEAAPCILVGVRDQALRRQLKLASLAFDGYVISCEGRRLILAGNVPEGTLNAVYGFLESTLGVRWFIPTALGENVPKRSTVAVPAGDRRDEPRFVNRRNHGVDLSIRGDGEAWRRRSRITSHDLAVPFNRYSHNLYRIVPPSKYGRSHPEYFPIRKGRRYVPARDNAQDWQPCTSNPAVVRLAIEAGKRWFAAHPRSNFFSVGMNDSGCFCECAACRAMDIPGEVFRGRPIVSDRYFTFVKQVADGLRASHPDKYVTAIAYSRVEALPKRVKLPANVGVVITQDVAQWHDPEYKKADQELAAGWAKATGAFGTYDYTGLTWIMPRVYPHLMAESLRFYDRIGAKAVTNEAFPTWWYAGPQMYLRAKLMWDPRQDADAVLGEFYNGFFGPAAEPMRRFYDVLERCMTKQRPGRWFEGLSSVIQQLDLWEERDLADCRQAMAAAKSAAGRTSPYTERVAFVERGFAWADALLEEYWQAGRVRELAEDGDAQTGAALAALRALLDRRRTREQVWRSIKDDRLVSGIYRLVFDRYASRVATWRSRVDSSVSVGMSALLSSPRAATGAQLRALAKEVGDPRLRQEVAGRLWLAEHPNAPNLLKNPGVEQTAASGEAPKGVDWVATGVPPGWAKWAIRKANRPKLTWQEREGRNGSRALRIQGVQEACFIQTVPARPGERYGVSVWARTKGSAGASASLAVQWKDADGAWVWAKGRRQAMLPTSTDGWRQASIVFTVPEGVARAVILLVAKGQQPDNAAWFDDASLVRLPEAKSRP